MNLSSIQRNNRLLHVFVFLLFLVVPFAAFVRPPGESMFLLTRPFVQNTLANILLYGFFYLNYFVLIPYYFQKGQFFAYGILALISLFVLLSIPHVIGGNLIEQGMLEKSQLEKFEEVNFKQPAPKSTLLFSFDEVRRHMFSIFSAVFLSLFVRTRERILLLKEEKLESELMLLKNQINPHFLFNAMNSLYALSITESEKTPKAIQELSEILRYSMKTTTEQVVTLQSELAYIENYLEFQKTRLGSTANVSYTISIENEGLLIAPMILSTYIENCFKHGINNDDSSNFIKISIVEKNKQLQLTTENKKSNQEKQQQSGIGMSNTMKRLNHLYSDRFKCSINENKERYQLELNLNLA